MLWKRLNCRISRKTAKNGFRISFDWLIRREGFENYVRVRDIVCAMWSSDGDKRDQRALDDIGVSSLLTCSPS
jgi:hypothetical protein